MKLFGFEITRTKASQSLESLVSSGSFGLGTLYGGNVWWPTILEGDTGDWQRGIVTDPPQNLLSFSAVWSCVTGISGDIAKLRPMQQRLADEVWEEVVSGSPFLPVLRKPNHYQTHIDFVESWILSKLLCGNTYVLLERDNRGGEGRGVVRAMYVLDPRRVKPLVTEGGDVYYELSIDHLAGIADRVVVSADQMIHDRHAPLYHPLVGVSPLYACAVSATMGIRIQGNSTRLFSNLSMPGGMLTAPGRIGDDTAKRLKAKFEEQFGGANFGRLFVGGDGLKFEPITMTAENAQLADQLKWTVEDVARAFHYPLYKLGGDWPPYSGGPEAAQTFYYTDCLQILIEKLEAGLDAAFGFGANEGVELDVENLLRMDTGAMMDTLEKGARSGLVAPDEGRRKLRLKPVPGGRYPYLQQQNYSLEALSKRDAGPDPFGTAAKTPSPQPQLPPPPAPQKALSPAEIELLADMELLAR